MDFEPSALQWGENGLLPAIVQDVTSGQILMLAYMNKESLERTLATGQTWFYSRSRQKLWHKGEQSGHVQIVEELLTDCDQDTLLIRVRQVGPGACHEGYYSCFHYGVKTVEASSEHIVSDREDTGVQPEEPVRTFDPNDVYKGSEQILNSLYQVILDRKAHPAEESYTTYLFREGINKILKKVGEESAEVIIAAKDPEKDPLVYEVADLFYHVLVLLAERDIHPNEVMTELQARRGRPPHRK